VNDKSRTIEDLVAERNRAKLLFTAGPASLLPENLTGLRPCFGRGDEDYAKVEQQVLDSLRSMTGHQQIARMQGSASLGLEIAALNFLFGRVLVVSTGYYSDRLKWLAESAQRRTGEINFIAMLNWNEMESASGQFDWIVACYTETSCALKLPIESLHALVKRLGARLMLDATASIGLEGGHELADVIAYSSCKGLFGLTGAAFIAFNEKPTAKPDSLYLNLETHLEKTVTGPYHAIASLLDVLPRHDDFRAAVIENKRIFVEKMASRLPLPRSHQPTLCTRVDGEIVSADPRAVLYKPRGNQGGSVVCHLGEVHLERQARGKILDVLQLAPQ
jgi:aspartate aminotransferase-like enzyme